MRTCVLFLFAVVCAACGQIPIKKCPPGEHSVLYCPQKAEPSCDNPRVHDRPAGACGIPDCFCDVPKVRNTNTNKCVFQSEC